MTRFEGLDLYGTEALLSPEERMIRDAVRGFVDREVLPIIEPYHREARFPLQIVPRMAELGLFGSTLTGYGCPGINSVAYGLAMAELERGDSAVRSFSSVQGGLVMFPIFAFGSELGFDSTEIAWSATAP